jgi:putative methyltransferase (TIGR04325 family)
MLRKLAAKFFQTPRQDQVVEFGLPSNDWDQVKKAAGSYSHEAILRRVATSTRAVVEGRAKAERDGVLFPVKQIPLSLLAGLRLCSLQKSRLHVLDFGGALGSTYRQCVGELSPHSIGKWVVVEQPHFVELGRREFEDGVLAFSYSLSNALKDYQIDVVIFSGVLEYVDDSLDLLKLVKYADVKAVFIDRTPAHNGLDDMFTIQKISKEIYGVPVSYPVRIYAFRKLVTDLERLFGRIYILNASFDPEMRMGDVKVNFHFFSNIQIVSTLNSIAE